MFPLAEGEKKADQEYHSYFLSLISRKGGGRGGKKGGMEVSYYNLLFSFCSLSPTIIGREKRGKRRKADTMYQGEEGGKDRDPGHNPPLLLFSPFSSGTGKKRKRKKRGKKEGEKERKEAYYHSLPTLRSAAKEEKKGEKKT